jgi:hypothetical protein
LLVFQFDLEHFFVRTRRNLISYVSVGFLLCQNIPSHKNYFSKNEHLFTQSVERKFISVHKNDRKNNSPHEMNAMHNIT